jgi:hypothetical protein
MSPAVFILLNVGGTAARLAAIRGAVCMTIVLSCFWLYLRVI